MSQGNVKGGDRAVNTEPAIVLGQLYSARVLMRRVGIGRETLQRWELAGLRPLSPGTKEHFYWAADVLRVMRLPAEQIPKLPTVVKKQARAAKRRHKPET
jgi:hypothetical protein